MATNDIERRTFEGGMNWDVDESRLQPGEYRYALNILNGTSRNGALGVITNIKGNELADTQFSLPGTMQGARVVAAFDDHKKNRVFFFVATVNNRPAIYYYDIINGKVVTVLEWRDQANKKIDTSVLGFTIDNLIPETNIDIIYREQGDLLCWTDGRTEPKKINIDQAVRTTSDKFIGDGNFPPGGIQPLSQGDIFYIDVATMSESVNKGVQVPEGEMVYYFEFIDDTPGSVVEDNYDSASDTQGLFFPIKLSGIPNEDNPKLSVNFINKDKFRLIRGGEVYPLPLLEEHITQMPKAPEEPQKPRYSTAPSRDTNFLKNRMWQFRYKFVYDDDQESHWSPISEVPLNSETMFTNVPGEVNIRPNFVDNVIKTLNYAKINSRITSIKFAVREGGSDNSKGDWGLVDEYELRDNGRTFLVRNEDADGDNTTAQAKLGSMSVVFTNSKTLTPIDITDVTQLFYNVPKRSKAQSLTEENRLVHANITEGYDIDLSLLKENPGSLSASPLKLSHPLNGDEEIPGVSVDFNNKGDASPDASDNIYDSFEIEIADPNDNLRAGDMIELDIKWWVSYRDRADTATDAAYDIPDYRFYPRQVFIPLQDNSGHDTESFSPTTVRFGVPNYIMEYNINPLQLSGEKIRYTITVLDEQEADSLSIPLSEVVAKKIAKRINEYDTYIPGNTYTTDGWEDPESYDIPDGFGDAVRKTALSNAKYDFFQNAANAASPENDQRWYHAVNAEHNGNKIVIDSKTHILSKSECVSGNTVNNILVSGTNTTAAVLSYEWKTFYKLDEPPKVISRERLFGRDGISQKSSKRGSPQQYGIAFADNYGRMSNVITTDAMGFTPDFPASGNKGISWADNKDTSGTVAVELNLPHAIIPDWATHYHVLRVNNKPKRRFIQLCTSTDDTSSESRNIFDLVDFTNDTANDAVKIYLDVLNGGGDRSINNLFNQRTVLSYQYLKGDRVRFLYKINTSVPDISSDPKRYYKSDVEILSFIPEENAIIIPKSDLEPWLRNHVFIVGNEKDEEVAAGIVFEIYSTNPQSGETDQEEAQLYYEIARTHPIITVGNQRRFGISRTPITIEGGTTERITSNSSTLIIKEGDVYFRPRIFNTDGKNLRIAWVEDENYSDFYVSDFTNIGRPNLPFRVKSSRFIKSGKVREVQRISSMVWSEPLIAETNVNQIGTIFDTSIKDFNRIHGGINALVTQDFRVKIFFDDRVGFVMLGRQVLDDLNQQNLIGTSTGTVSEIQYYTGQYGCVAPRSIEEKGNRIYFADPKRGAICQLAENGIVEINNGMDTLFKKIFQEQYESEIGVETLACYDKNNSLYVLNVKSAPFQVDATDKQPFNVPEVNGVTGARVRISSIGDGNFQTPEDLPQGYVEGNWIDYRIEQYEGFPQADQRFFIESFEQDSGDWYMNVWILEYDTNVPVQQPDPPFVFWLRFPITNSTTIAYSDVFNKWVSFYSYSPDYMVNAGLGIITFRAGLPYIHEATNDFANFYGTDYDTQIQIVSNKGNSQSKIYKTLAINSPDRDVWDGNTFAPREILSDYETGRIIYPVETNIQSVFNDSEDPNYKLPYQSRILQSDIVPNEGMQSTAFNKNENQPDPDNPDNKLSNALKMGDSEMRGNWLKVILSMPKGINRRVRLLDVIFKFALSEYNQKP